MKCWMRAQGLEQGGDGKGRGDNDQRIALVVPVLSILFAKERRRAPCSRSRHHASLPQDYTKLPLQKHYGKRNENLIRDDLGRTNGDKANPSSLYFPQVYRLVSAFLLSPPGTPRWKQPGKRRATA